MASRHKDDSNESRRILERIQREEPSAPNFIIRTQNHLNATDVDPDDRIEYWGTRIGRVLGFLITVGLLIWVSSYLVRGG